MSEFRIKKDMSRLSLLSIYPSPSLRTMSIRAVIQIDVHIHTPRPLMKYTGENVDSPNLGPDGKITYFLPSFCIT